jgi:two-component system, OmpR family, response regulator ChvI
MTCLELGERGMPTIGLVNGDRVTLTSLSSALEENGHKVVTYIDGQSALNELSIIQARLVILETRPPRIDGMEILRRIRQTSVVPVMLLTSTADETDQIIGFRMGADDIIHKPFSARVLVQRVETLLKRGIGNAKTEGSSVIERGPLCIDMARHTCFWNGQRVSLTRSQISVLELMARRPGIVMTRDSLMRRAYHEEPRVNERAIDTYIKHLRKSFKAIDCSFHMIETVNGVGYRLKECNFATLPGEGDDRYRGQGPRYDVRPFGAIQ